MNKIIEKYKEFEINITDNKEYVVVWVDFNRELVGQVMENNIKLEIDKNTIGISGRITTSRYDKVMKIMNLAKEIQKEYWGGKE